MKRLIALLALIFLLTGCVWNSDTPGTTLPLTTPPAPGTTGSAAPVECSGHESDPYTNVNKEAFYAN